MTTSEHAGIGATGYSHVAIDVTDLEAARAFYGGLLGMEELPRPELGIPGAWFRTGDLQLHLVETERAASASGYHLAFYVPTDRLQMVVDGLAEAGVDVVSPVRHRDDFGVTVRAAFVKDPSGNLVELTDVGPLPAR